MIYKITLLSVLLIFSRQLKAQDSNQPPETVKFVDINKYLGLWYEIAKIPNRFQKNCSGNTTAEYKLRDDGKIDVINTCTESNGEKNEAKGVAKIVDKKTNSKLEVSFFSILGIRPVWGDYWIIGLDKNYEYAIVGHPKRKYGWILSRKPVLSKEKLDEAFNILKLRGYDTSKFVFTSQKE
jgi:apolipoprotein D and lipocalin family protein